MQRIARDNTVPVEQRYRIREPVAEVGLGERFIVETINFRTPVIRTPEDANPDVYREREETGPIFVEGVEPGDVLAIHIEGIQPEGHASGGWWEDPKVASFLKIEDDKVHFPGGLWAPVRMMIGDIYVTPAELPCPNPHDNGGNMDFKDVAAGNALFLKAQLPGGLLVLGDCHAVQGDGEILGLGAECAGEVQLRITKDEVYLPDRPMIRKADSFVSIACRPAYAEARDLAVDDAKRILSRIKGCSVGEAHLYVTTVGDLRNGAVWYMGRAEHPPVVVGVEVPLLGDVIDMRPHHFIDILRGLGACEAFEPSPYGHAVHSVAQALVEDPETVLRLVNRCDAICAPCIHNADGTCDDYLQDRNMSKHDFNTALDARLFEVLGLTEETELPGRAFCRILRASLGDPSKIWTHVSREEAENRSQMMLKGIDTFLGQAS